MISIMFETYEVVIIYIKLIQYVRLKTNIKE